TAQVDGLADLDVARVMGEYYELAAATITAAGGRVVKFIGDATLTVFPSEDVDRGVLALLELTGAADRFMRERGWKCHLAGKAHLTTGRPNERLKLPARVDWGMNLSSARRSSGAVR